ncbi:response regulator [Clostridioides sp. ES-S-0077-01]|uniref:response regulator n=1 Tax=Clostridioides sp. ES-S-0077-01 TaxID=2770782 RepID=UPI001D0F4C48
MLVIDDHKELLKMIDEILKKEGVSRVFLASNYEEVVRIFRNIKPDCAILDIVLPDGDGFSIMRKIRETSKIPVTFLSARGEDKDRLIGLGLGADG